MTLTSAAAAKLLTLILKVGTATLGDVMRAPVKMARAAPALDTLVAKPTILDAIVHTILDFAILM